eukprot:TRINITY_DN557_c0_g1_i2.p2 TRINITY_DN557_c0_g1~~TRINITY_DN557_c0_g1_i2.p2  ORF type:complete len:229 (-),score=45.04 TRINITY_DN557_c0_g1_i2:375-1061(-)
MCFQRIRITTSLKACVPQPARPPVPVPISDLDIVSVTDSRISAVRTGPLTAVIGSWALQPEHMGRAVQFLRSQIGAQDVILTGADFKKGEETPLIYNMAAEAGKTNKVVAVSHPKNLQPTDDGKARKCLPSNTFVVLDSERTDGWGGGTTDSPVGATATTLELLKTSSRPKVLVLGGGTVAAQEVEIFYQAGIEVVALDVPRNTGGQCLGVLKASALGCRVVCCGQDS